MYVRYAVDPRDCAQRLLYEGVLDCVDARLLRVRWLFDAQFRALCAFSAYAMRCRCAIYVPLMHAFNKTTLRLMRLGSASDVGATFPRC